MGYGGARMITLGCDSAPPTQKGAGHETRLRHPSASEVAEL